MYYNYKWKDMYIFELYKYAMYSVCFKKYNIILKWE